VAEVARLLFCLTADMLQLAQGELQGLIPRNVVDSNSV
jgi:hypothetical protein